MSDGPKTISLLPDDGWSWMEGRSVYEPSAIGYTLTDHVQTLTAEAVAAAYDDAAEICLAQCDQASGGYSSVALATAEAGSEAIRARTPADALASLVARDRRKKNEALREAGQRLLELNQPAHAEIVFAMIDADDKEP